MIVYGELDTGLGLSSSRDLQLIPASTQPQVLPGAKHPAYLDQVTPAGPDLVSQTSDVLSVSAPALAPAPLQLHLRTLSLSPVLPVTRVLCDV